VTAALAHVPASLDELFRMLGDACAVCGEKTVSDNEDGLRVASCPSCGSVLEDAREAARPRLRLVP
jgi:rRNA maturation protein Nop10